MAATSLLTLLDDIATVLDDVAIMTKVAARKTAGVLGDDLALNAEQVTGVSADRELPVVWEVAKGALVNKAILVPSALAIAQFIPWATLPLLMIGGGFLTYEGFHKVLEKLSNRDEDKAAAVREAIRDPNVDMAEFEKEKIKGAIRTDFILSAEIIVIALNTVATKPFATQLGVLIAIGLGMVILVYGLVAAIVKIDDVGAHLVKTSAQDSVKDRVGDGILRAAPIFMRGLGIFGTIAMFLVGGGILAHGIGPIEHVIATWSTALGSFDWILSSLLNGVVGVIGGALIYGVVHAVAKVYASVSKEASD